MSFDETAPGEVRIGIPGWRYEPWRGVFYAEGLPQRRELEFASRALGLERARGAAVPASRNQLT